MFPSFARAVSTVTLASFLSACATSSKDVASQYVSPMQYQSYSCAQIMQEQQRVSIRVSQLGGRLDEAANNDKAIMGVAILLFWPALFALGGTKQQEAEYARLKGEHDGLAQASNMKNCAAGNQVAPAIQPSPVSGAAQLASPPAIRSGEIRSERTGLEGLPVAMGEIDTVEPPALLSAGTLAFGGKQFLLSGSSWVLAARSAGFATARKTLAGPMPPPTSVPVVSASVILREGQRLGAAYVVSSSAKSPGTVAAWDVDQCKPIGPLFVDRFAGRFDTPECLFVRPVKLQDNPSVDSIFGPALRWHRRAGGSVGTGGYHVSYARYGTEDFVIVEALLSDDQMSKEGLVVDWARSLADAMRPVGQSRGAAVIGLPRWTNN